MKINRDVGGLAQQVRTEISVLNVVTDRPRENVRWLKHGVSPTNPRTNLWKNGNVAFVGAANLIRVRTEANGNHGTAWILPRLAGA